MKIIAKSSDFKHIYADNKSSDFRIELLSQTAFDPCAQVTLTHLIVPPVEEDKICYILCSVCCYSQCSEVYRRVLRVVHLPANKFAQQVLLETAERFDLNHNIIHEIRFSFRDEKENHIKFTEGFETYIGIEIK